MTSSNVSNMLISGLNNISNEITDLKQNMQVNDDTFEKTLNSIANVSVTQTVTTSQTSNSDLNKTLVQSDGQDKMSVKTQDYNKKISESQEEELSDEEVNEIAEKVEAFSDKVKDVIKEELDVTDEEIEDAMEVLGLTALDLVNPENLAQLVMKLNDSTDSVELLVSDDFKNILDKVFELSNELLEETGFSSVEIKDILITFESEGNQQVDFSQDLAFGSELPEEELEDSPAVIDEAIKTPVVQESPIQNVKPNVVESVDEQNENPNEIVASEEIKVGDTEMETDSDSQGFEFSKESKSDVEENQSDLTNDSQGVIFNAESKIEYSPVNDEVTLPTGETVSTTEIIDQIVEQAKIINSEETTTMEMTLNPEGLGKIYMEVTQKGDEVTAKIFTENEVVKEALENQMASLRSQMNESATKVTSIEVSVGTHEFERNLEEDARNQENAEEQSRQQQPKRNHINLVNMDELSGIMSEEEQLVAQIMRDNGNTLDYQA